VVLCLIIGEILPKNNRICWTLCFFREIVPNYSLISVILSNLGVFLGSNSLIVGNMMIKWRKSGSNSLIPFPSSVSERSLVVEPLARKGFPKTSK